MIIAMLLDREFPHDDRVYKEAKSLIAAGHVVHLICFRHNDKSPSEIIDGIQVHRVHLSKFLFNKLSILTLAFPVYRWFWNYQLDKFLRTCLVDVLHIHDLPLSSVGIKLRKKYKFQLVIDMHEDYADWVVNTSHYNKPLGKVVKLFSNWKSYENKCLNDADWVIGVSEKLITKMKQDYKLTSDKLYNIPNAPDLSVFNENSVNSSINQRLSGKYNIVYSGGIDFLRGLQHVIPALNELKENISNLQLVIVGDGNYLSELKKLACDNSVEKSILFAGYQNIKNLASYIYYSQVGIYPQLSYPGIDETLPTKLYQYCAMGIPVLSSDHKLPREFITKHNCGYTVNFENRDDFINKAMLLYSNFTRAQEFGQNGKVAVQQNYTWEIVSQNLIKMYQAISEKV